MPDLANLAGHWPILPPESRASWVIPMRIGHELWSVRKNAAIMPSHEPRRHSKRKKKDVRGLSK